MAWKSPLGTLVALQALVSYLDGNQMSEERNLHVNGPYGPDCISGSSALTFRDEPPTFGVNSSSTEQSKALTVGERNSHFLCPSNQSTQTLKGQLFQK